MTTTGRRPQVAQRHSHSSGPGYDDGIDVTRALAANAGDVLISPLVTVRLLRSLAPTAGRYRRRDA